MRAAKKIQFEGHTFEGAEAVRRYVELKAMQERGEISGFRINDRFPVDIEGHHVFDFRADFVYWDKVEQELVFECAQDVITAHERLKIKIFELVHGQKVTKVFAKKPRRCDVRAA